MRVQFSIYCNVSLTFSNDLWGGIKIKQKWVFTCLALCAAVLAAFLSTGNTDNPMLLLVQDSLDPMADLLEPYGGNSIVRLDPYRLGHQLPGLKGMAFVFGTQARPYQKQQSQANYVPLYSATVVIAVNRNGNSAGAVRGWRTLLDSQAVVLIPDHGTEGGRLAAIALARGLGAQEGNLTPALDAFRQLLEQGRLNPPDEYSYEGCRHVYNPDRLPVFDAVIMWDYQARTLIGNSPDWDIVFPEEGELWVDCGFVQGGSWGQKDLRQATEFLSSDLGQQTLVDAGFSPLRGQEDLSAWDREKLTYNPRFRRSVRSVKLYAPASVFERLLLQSATMLLFFIAAQRILRRVPQGQYRTTSFIALLFVALWMLMGMMKTLSLHYDPKRYFWFATYISRHALPMFWYYMCHVHVGKGLPSPKKLIPLGLTVFLLAAMVLTNDYHNQVFAYALADPETWEHQYSNGWGYYLSLFWSFSLSIAGVILLVRQKLSRQQRRQYVYAGIFFALLLAYQALYIAGVEYIIDLDIPTTVAMVILLFIFAAQQERFMGASLLALPIFRNSPHAIAVSDAHGQDVYRNDVMAALEQEGNLVGEELYQSPQIISGGKVFKSNVYTLDQGRALILEDITDLMELEQSLKHTHKRLAAVRKLLIRQADETRALTGPMERQRYSLQMDLLLREKLEQVRQALGRITQQDSGEQSHGSLARIRLLIGICQQRLRLFIRSLETHPYFPAQLMEEYAAGIIKEGQRMGGDCVLTARVSGNVPSGLIPALLEAIDILCLYAFDAGSSLICCLGTNAAAVSLNALLSWGDGKPPTHEAILPDSLVAKFSRLGGQAHEEMGEDGLLARVNIPYGGVQQ